MARWADTEEEEDWAKAARLEGTEEVSGIARVARRRVTEEVSGRANMAIYGETLRRRQAGKRWRSNEDVANIPAFEQSPTSSQTTTP